LRWEMLDTQDGAFEDGWTPRNKAERPQRLAIPETMRPFIRDWWERHGRPISGLVFPALRGVNAGRAEKRGVSHAAAMRRDLQRAFGAAHAASPNSELPRRGGARWRELFDETDLTKPVDFHSWRRAYNQALADAGLNAQEAAALAGHASLSAHQRYL